MKRIVTVDTFFHKLKGEKTKRCTCCRKIKSLEKDFYNDVSHEKDGKRSLCKICYNTYEKQPHRKFRNAIAGRISSVIGRYGIEKLPKRTQEILGCTALELQAWLKSQFTSDMGFWNHGHKGWHVDHIKSIDAHLKELGGKATEKEQQEAIIKANHYTNLRPYSGKKNMSDGSRQRVNEAKLIGAAKDKNIKSLKIEHYPRGTTKKIINPRTVVSAFE